MDIEDGRDGSSAKVLAELLPDRPLEGSICYPDIYENNNPVKKLIRFAHQLLIGFLTEIPFTST